MLSAWRLLHSQSAIMITRTGGWLLLILAVSVAAWFLGEAYGDAVVRLLVDNVVRLAEWAPLVWVLVFAMLSAFFFPVAILSLASGALFGVGWGTVFTLLGATAGATLSLFLGRNWLFSRLEKQLGPRAEALRQRVDSEGWRFVAFTRLLPLMPFALLNFSFGLTHIRIIPYALTTFVFMLPARWAYAYAGDVGWSVFEQQFIEYRWPVVVLGLMLMLAYGWHLVAPRKKLPDSE